MMNLITYTRIFFIVFIVLVIIFRIGLGISIILIHLLQHCCLGYASFGRFIVPQEIFVRIFISTSRFEKVQVLFCGLMLNFSGFAKDENSLFICSKKFMNEDDIIFKCVFQSLIYHLRSEVFSFANSVLDFSLDERDF
jgi:hypothetical protein